MILDDQLPELVYFRKAETRSRFEILELYQNLVVAGVNDRSPVHRWFRFKESFSADLLKTIIDEIKPAKKQLSLLDPFCGVGTSLLSSQELSLDGYTVTATGIERNPFIAFVARTKVGWPKIDGSQFHRLSNLALTKRSKETLPLPQNSSFLTSRCITPHTTRRLLEIAQNIRQHGSTPTHNALLLGLASAIEPLSRTRKDGRALRLVEKPKANIKAVLTEKWDAIAEDVTLMQNSMESPPKPRVLFGDGRRPTSLGIARASQDLIFTSPPYPNNIDYTEVYKLELWLMGHVTTSEEFLQLRRKTFRSHPSIGLAEPAEDFIRASKRGRLASLLNPILSRIIDLEEPWRRRVLLGYFSDLWTTLEECHYVLRKGGHAVFVVGNSLHGATSNPYLIPTDLILGAIAERVGFDIVRTIGARSLKRRLSGNHFLRESVIILRKRRG
jgi:hypothetical protein